MKLPKISESQERGDRRRNGAKGDIKKNIEAVELLTQEMEVIHHGEVTTAGLSTAELLRALRSVRAERLPLTRTRSPGSAISPSSSAASLGRSRRTKLCPSRRCCAASRNRSRRVADRDQMIDAERRCGFADFPVPALRFGAEFAHFARARRCACPSASSSTSVRNAAFIESGLAL